MTLNGYFALKPIVAPVRLASDRVNFENKCVKTNKIDTYYQQCKSSTVNVVSGNIRFVRIFEPMNLGVGHCFTCTEGRRSVLLKDEQFASDGTASSATGTFHFDTRLNKIILDQCDPVILYVDR